MRTVAIRSELAGYSSLEARRALEGLPRCDYEVVIKPLRYRWSPHLAARCEFEDHRIVLQVPTPFRPFKEPVIFAARRKRGEGMRFALRNFRRRVVTTDDADEALIRRGRLAARG